MRGANRKPPPEDVLADLIEFHTARPGITEATLGVCTTAEGKTGYDLLVERLPAGARNVLDLGCGNGPLLERLAARTPRLERIYGVDLCASDLELARARVADERVVLLCEPGQALSLSDGTVDAVLSHHAFYLMDPVEPALAEIARVLRPGGVFAFVSFGPGHGPPEPLETMMQRFGELTQRDNPHFKGWGDRRVFSSEGLDALLFRSGVGFAGPLHVEPFVLELVEPSQALVARLMGFFYSVELEKAETREELREAWLTALASTAGVDGNARLEFPLTMVWVKRAG